MVDDFVFDFLVVGKAFEREGWISSNSEEAKSRLCKGEDLFDFCILSCLLIYLPCMHLFPCTHTDTIDLSVKYIFFYLFLHFFCVPDDFFSIF